MDFVEILKELGTWGGAVLLGSMGFTELVKRTAKRNAANVPWYVWLIMPSALAIIGVMGMVMAGVLAPEMALIVWFVVSFAGPLLYMYIVRPALVKIGAKESG